MGSIKTNNSNTKRALLIGFLVLLGLPLFQDITQLIKLKPLDGYFVAMEKPEFSWKSWFEGEYQNKQQDYIEENIGFRSLFVRIYNQMGYSLFKEPNAKGVIEGKEKYLYEMAYVNAALGRDFVGYDTIADKTDKLMVLIDTFRSMDIDLVMMLAPGKGTFYPEYIPDKYEPHTKSCTNYEVFRDKMEDKEIPFFDTQQWFLDRKETSPYQLYPRTGIHWSKFGALMVVDSLVKYLEKSKQVDMPDLIIDTIHTSRRAKNTDDDIERSLNLLFRISHDQLAYPVFHVESDSSKKMLKLLSIADSFYWVIETTGLVNQLYDGSFLYYAQQLYPENYTTPTCISDINIKEVLEKQDVIILLSTDCNLPVFAFKVIDQLYDLYFPAK